MLTAFAILGGVVLWLTIGILIYKVAHKIDPHLFSRRERAVIVGIWPIPIILLFMICFEKFLDLILGDD